MSQEHDLYAALYCDTLEDMEIFSKWADERMIETVLAREAENETPVCLDNRQLAKAVRPYDKCIEAGQIRLLSKRYVANPDYIPYVAVIEEWDPGIWLVLPFAPYGTPATPNEMETGLPLYSLEVLQAWNGRTVPGVVLERSWLAGEMEESLRADASALFRHALSGKALPDDFSRLRGPAIVTEGDPRLEYLDQFSRQYCPMEMATHFALRQRILEAEANRRLERMRELVRPKTELAWAAGEKAAPTVKYCLVAGMGDFGGKVRFEYNPDTQRLSLRVYGPDRKRSSALDGMGVFGRGAELLGIIMNGAFAVEPLDCPDTLPVLSDSEGNPYPLEAEE